MKAGCLVIHWSCFSGHVPALIRSALGFTKITNKIIPGEILHNYTRVNKRKPTPAV
uniref:Uncharacterized protein n=1 Tax=Magallana gigas TaxID=29159 RepID=K1QN41_MAGGI